MTEMLENPPDSGLFVLVDDTEASDAVPVSWRVSGRREDIITQVVLARETDATPITFDSPTGQRLYGIETWEATDLVCTSSTQLSRLALRLLRTRGFGTGPRRVDGVLFNAATSEQVADLIAVLSPFVPHRLRCHLELDRGEVFDDVMFVTGVTHRMGPDRWECELNLDLSGPWEAVAGRWDEASWDLNVWSGTV